MATALAIGTLVGSAIQGIGAYSSKKNTEDALNSQYGLLESQRAAQEGYLGSIGEALAGFSEEGSAIAEETFALINDIISKIPSVKSLFTDAVDLSRQDFDYRTGIQRENLGFILGDTQNQLRDIQSLNASVAQLNPEGLNNRIQDVIRSSMYGLKSITLGEPSGSFANLSAKNIYDFSNQALSNYLAINDFFAREGTVDPISPLETAFELRQAEENIAGLYIDNAKMRSDALLGINQSVLGGSLDMAKLGIGIEQQYGSDLINLSNAGIINDSNAQAGYSSAIGTLISGLGSYYGLSMKEKELKLLQDRYGALGSKYN